MYKLLFISGHGLECVRVIQPLVGNGQAHHHIQVHFAPHPTGRNSSPLLIARHGFERILVFQHLVVDGQAHHPVDAPKGQALRAGGRRYGAHDGGGVAQAAGDLRQKCGEKVWGKWGSLLLALELIVGLCSNSRSTQGCQAWKEAVVLISLYIVYILAYNNL